MVAMEKKTKLVEEEDGCYYYDYGGYGDGVVDDEGRATELRPMALSRPHTQAFHLAWMSLFACFFAAFAAPPILPAMRPALVLAPSDASAAAVASLSATLVGRLAMGPACDLLGPRRASGVASLVCALALALAAVFASSPAGFVALRFVAGLSLANFVANQHWMSRIFAPSAVGLANAVAAGWANVGSAAAQVVMPVAYDAVVLRLGVPVTVAWRVTYLLPSLGVVSGMTASGGAVGAIVTNRLFFSGSRYTVEEAISCTGITSLLCTLPVALIHFRRQGGMFCGPSATIDGDGDVDDDDDYMLLK
ncbi:Os01g0547600 [Oryza sativa Japonica Group]|uniref:Os01g0547600 protein n=1 Tax=Oryza sativa subsp. japonica TaxID=39947 RepID=A0A0P0V3U2_ORYSJ|nr:Os01g0547600 [Oryza sativa Japonica Group]